MPTNALKEEQRQERDAAQPDIEKLAAEIDRLTAELDSAEADSEISPVDAKQLLATVNAFHREGLLQLLRQLRSNEAAAKALRNAVTDPAVYTLFRRHGLLKPSRVEQISLALDCVRPSLKSHGGDVEFVDIIDPNTVRLRLLGACDGCGSSDVTLKQGVEKALYDACDWIQKIEVVAGESGAATEKPVHFISPFQASNASKSSTGVEAVT